MFYFKLLITYVVLDNSWTKQVDRVVTQPKHTRVLSPCAEKTTRQRGCKPRDTFISLHRVTRSYKHYISACLNPIYYFDVFAVIANGINCNTHSLATSQYLKFLRHKRAHAPQHRQTISSPEYVFREAKPMKTMSEPQEY